MLEAIIFIAIGFPLLIYGGNFLVDGSIDLAHQYKISPAIISVTIVAIGTSMPEAIVSMLASAKDSSDIAAANVVGSNIVNIAVVLGATAFFRKIPVGGSVVRIEWPFLLFASFLALAFMRDLTVDRIEGAILILAMCAFSSLMIWLARRQRKGEADTREGISEISTPPSAPRLYLYLLGGFALLFVGGNLVLEGAVNGARLLGISERVIGLTIISIGTGLPEIVTSVIAATRKVHEIVIGNVIGSNIYNIVLVLGLAALIKPLSVSPELLQIDIWVMIGVTLILFPLMHFMKEIPRWAGALFLLGWISYTGYLIVNPS